MNSHHRLSQLRRPPDELLLALRQIDVRGVHALTHGCHRAGAVLAPKGHQDDIRLFCQPQGLFHMGEIVSRDGIPIGVPNLHTPRLLPELLQNAGAARFLMAQNLVKLFRLIALNLGPGHRHQLLALDAA